MSANAAACPSTLETATSRSQSRASNRRINPKATDRMTRLSPPSAVPITIERGVVAGGGTDQHDDHRDRVGDETDHQPEPGVGPDDARRLGVVRREHVGEHDPRDAQVGDEADDPEQGEDDRVLAELLDRQLADDDDRCRPTPARRRRNARPRARSHPTAATPTSGAGPGCRRRRTSRSRRSAGDGRRPRFDASSEWEVHETHVATLAQDLDRVLLGALVVDDPAVVGVDPDADEVHAVEHGEPVERRTGRCRPRPPSPGRRP